MITNAERILAAGLAAAALIACLFFLILKGATHIDAVAGPADPGTANALRMDAEAPNLWKFIPFDLRWPDELFGPAAGDGSG
ncbi:MAG: hypothetical protein K2Z80_27760 [Xanthobacteraceae bacterium]|nr:hypothetical protein [Xanthobacteraceae bacterium]